MIYKYFTKRIIDISLSIVILLMTSVIIILIGAVLYYSNHKQIFFRQFRPGKNAKVFKIIKFKTMADRFDAQGHLLPDGERLTKFGRFLRSSSLDELPQFFNVLKGDMSIVGPRPLLLKYLPLYNMNQAMRHNVRPGITGWAQVNGRNAISWEQKFDYDVFYVKNVSLTLDLKILLLTLKKILKREGVSSSTCPTMEAFKGNL